jgi:hypothetical protein
VTPLMIRFSTVTLQVIPVVAPGPGPMLLHWSTAMFAALAPSGRCARPRTTIAGRTMSRASRPVRQVSRI